MEPIDRINVPVPPEPKFKLGQRVFPVLNPNIELMVIQVLHNANGFVYNYSCRTVDLSIMLFNEFELEALDE